ncbi:MAG: hypoxanthine phosphoribosyltransferase [Bacteroidaceae bacterium]|nr:hypoxanthine phosphoribosyltransferase [Bacteroidaceae bacterium]
MEKIHVKDKDFTISIRNEEIMKHVEEIAKRINHDFADKDPLFISLLNGSFMFTADLMKLINFSCEVQFVKYASYEGMNTTGEVKEMIGLKGDISGRIVIILEDIVDTGITMKHMVETLKAKNPKEIHICTFFAKPENLQVDLDLDYVAMNIPNDFIVGYGLDYDGYGRNYADIYTVVK